MKSEYQEERARQFDAPQFDELAALIEDDDCVRFIRKLYCVETRLFELAPLTMQFGDSFVQISRFEPLGPGSLFETKKWHGAYYPFAVDSDGYEYLLCLDGSSEYLFFYQRPEHDPEEIPIKSNEFIDALAELGT